MRHLLALAMFFLTALAAAEPIRATAAKPPIAKKVEHLTDLHGEKLIDHYFWLRDKKSPEVLGYLEAENAYTDAVMKPTEALQETLYKEMLGRIKQTDLSVPYRIGAHWYYSRTEEGKQYPIRCRKKGKDGPEEVLLDLNELARGHKYLALGEFVVSDDQNLLAYTLDVSGFRDYTLFVKDLRTGKTLPDRVEKVTDLIWAADNATLFYVTEDHSKRAYRAHRHRLGREKDDLVYEEKDKLYRVNVGRSRDKRHLFINSASMTTTETQFFPADKPDATPRILRPREEDHKYSADHRAGKFYILSDKDAVNFRLMTASVETPDKWEEMIAHDPDVALESLHLFKDHCVLAERVKGLPGFRVLDLVSGKSHRVEFAEAIYSTSPETNIEFDTALFRFNYASFTTPPSIYDYDLVKRERTLLKQNEVLGAYDPKAYVSERRFAKASDGTLIPISLMYRKGTKLDGTAPMLLYGYGAYGSSVPVGFNSNRLSLVDRGVIFAMAHVRGGGDMGPMWHRQGKMLTKRNSFTDFIACADYLVDNKYAARDRLVIQGRSAGGLLMGGVLTLKPDVAKAAVVEVPFVEAINSMLDLDMPLVIQEFLEWGNPRKKEEYDYMKTYCPYTNLKARDYPSMLVTTYLNDSQCMYWEAAKYTAKLRTLKTDSNPLLLRANLAGGHGGASGRYDGLREQAFIYAFILNQMGIEK